MKIIITESQYNRILKEEEEQKVLSIPSLKVFGGNWDLLQKFLEKKGNPPYTIGGNLDLFGKPIKSLGNLQSVGGYLNLWGTPLSKKYTEEQIREMVDVGSRIYM